MGVLKPRHFSMYTHGHPVCSFHDIYFYLHQLYLRLGLYTHTYVNSDITCLSALPCKYNVSRLHGAVPLNNANTHKHIKNKVAYWCSRVRITFLFSHRDFFHCRSQRTGCMYVPKLSRLGHVTGRDMFYGYQYICVGL